MAHELQEEAGYSLPELQVLQPFQSVPKLGEPVAHPIPFLMNTHNVGNGHFHSDLCYGFIARDFAVGSRADGESADIRWYSLKQLDALKDAGEALSDMVEIYRTLIEYLPELHRLDPTICSLEKPTTGISYKRGAPGQAS